MASLIDRIKRLFKRNADGAENIENHSKSAGTRNTKEQQQQQQQKPVAPSDRSEPPEEIQQRTTADTMASGTFTIQLRNDTNSSTVYGYISQSSSSLLQDTYRSLTS